MFPASLHNDSNCGLRRKRDNHICADPDPSERCNIRRFILRRRLALVLLSAPEHLSSLGWLRRWSRCINVDLRGRPGQTSVEARGNNVCSGCGRGALLVGYCLPVVSILLDTWRMDLPPLPGIILLLNIRAKPVWSLLSSLQSAQTFPHRSRDCTLELNGYREVGFSASSVRSVQYDSVPSVVR